MAKSGYVWDGSAWVPFTAPVGAVPNAVSAYSSIAPSNPQIGQMWFDASNNVLKVWNGSSWITNTIGSNTLNINAIKHPSSSVNNIVLNSDGTVTGGLPAGGRNLLYNGAMQVAQRGTSTASITANGYYTADRWQTGNATLGTWTQSIENDAPTGSGLRKSLKMLCTTADASPASADELSLQQSLEGQDLQRIAKGTSSAQQLTFSFWVKSSTTGTYTILMYDADNTRSVSASYSISASGTWEQKKITFPADTTGAFDNDNAASLSVRFYLAAGSNFTSGTLATTWAAYTAANTAVGQVNLAASTNNYWQVTGVQLETGSIATNFEFKTFSQELFECQRYYDKSYDYTVAPGTATFNGMRGGGPILASGTASTVRYYTSFSRRMRTTPSTITVYDSAGNSGKVNLPDVTTNRTGTVLHQNDASFGVEASPAAASADTRMYYHYIASAEL